MAAEERVRGLLCDLVYIGVWFALAPLYALGGGIEGLRWAALAEAVYLWASGLYR